MPTMADARSAIVSCAWRRVAKAWPGSSSATWSRSNVPLSASVRQSARDPEKGFGRYSRSPSGPVECRSQALFFPAWSVSVASALRPGTWFPQTTEAALGNTWRE